MVVLPSGVTIPSIQDSRISEDGTMENERIEKNINKMCTEHQWYVQALESQKSNTNGYPNWLRNFKYKITLLKPLYRIPLAINSPHLKNVNGKPESEVYCMCSTELCNEGTIVWPPASFSSSVE